MKGVVTLIAIQVDKLEPDTVGLGILVLVIGLTVRVLVTFGAVGCGDLRLKERLFIALAWLPKATVQAAIGGLALDQVRKTHPDDAELLRLGLQVLTIAVLVILITAPVGACAILLTAPKFLDKAPPSAPPLATQVDQGTHIEEEKQSV